MSEVEHVSVKPQLHAKPKKGSREGLSNGAITGLNLNGLGSAEVLEIQYLNIDPDYQRDVRHDLVNSIGRNYDIVKAGAILVSNREDGTLWVVDGQHRVLGAAQAGETEVFAHVVHGYDQAGEAELRMARNDRKSDTIAEKFRARMVMGDQKVHKIMDVVQQAGGEINLNTPSGYHGINAIATLEVLYDIDETGVWLARTLKMISDAFDGELNPQTASTSMLKATGWFIGQHIDQREATWGEFAQRLGVVGVEDLRRKAVSHKAANGGALWVNYYRAMVEMWNFKRTENKKLKWKTIGGIASLGEHDTRRMSWNREAGASH